MQHSKSYIQAEDLREAIGHLYNEIEELERKLRNLERKVDYIED